MKKIYREQVKKDIEVFEKKNGNNVIKINGKWYTHEEMLRRRQKNLISCKKLFSSAN